MSIHGSNKDDIMNESSFINQSNSIIDNDDDNDIGKLEYGYFNGYYYCYGYGHSYDYVLWFMIMITVWVIRNMVMVIVMVFVMVIIIVMIMSFR